MPEKRVQDIIRPLEAGVPLEPAVMVHDKLIYAIEMMVRSNLSAITVVRHDRPIGMVRLHDALEELGLQVKTKSQDPPRPSKPLSNSL